MARFQYLRISLSIPPLGPLHLGEVQQEPDIAREDFLRQLFEKRQDFFHRGRLFSYAPSPTNREGDPFLAGFIGKQVEQAVQGGPDQLFAITKQKYWKASFVAIDVRPDSQLIAFEKRSDVGSADKILESLFESYIRNRKSYSWHVDLEYLQRQEDFWKAAQENYGTITELSFEFFPANGLRGFDKFKELDKIAKRQSNGEKSIYSLKNNDGALKPEGEFIESAAEYATEGAGSIKMKSGRRVVYSSRKTKREEDANEELMPRQGETSKILGLIEWLFRKIR